MSAILNSCPHCGARCVSGMVGTTPWPAHRCAAPADAGLPPTLPTPPEWTTGSIARTA